MGEVYEARDVRLERRVAIKVLPAAFAADAERRARLEREARLIATLNHPHICTLYDVGHHDGHEYFVMERLEGVTLAARLARGPLAPAEALTVAAQVADALAAAHAQGIVHRDLKPGNVMLTAVGAKLLDFGIAKHNDDGRADPLGPTTLQPITVEGVIVGTLRYMAPEQLQGRPVDHRADIFALGAILYEMVSGKGAFDAPDSASIIAAVVSSEPVPLADLVPGIPRAVARIVRVCLAKDPAGRWSSARDVAIQLRGAIDESTVTASLPAAAGRAPRGRLAWAITALAVVALAGLVATLVMRFDRGVDRPSIKLGLLPPGQALLQSGEAPQVAPDGRRVAFVALDAGGRSLLYVRELDADEAKPLPGSEGALQPFWAPDSRRLGFFAEGRLKTVAIGGGAPQVLARASVPRGGSWGADDVIVFVPDPPMPMQRISASGGSPEPLPLDEFSFRWFPSFLPDGRHYVFLALGQGQLGSGLRLGAIDRGESRELVTSRSSGTFVEPGYLLYRRDSALVAQPMDPERLVLTGEPAVVGSGVGFNAISYQTLFSASRTGVLAYRASAPSNELVWIDVRGQRTVAVTSGADHNVVCLTPDSQPVVYDAVDLETGAVDLWQSNLATGDATRLTFGPAVDFLPVCAPLTAEVVFSSLRAGSPDLYRLSLEQPGRDQMFLDTPAAKIATDWSDDGRSIVYSTLERETSWDVWMAPIDGGAPRALVASPAEERNGVLSPDGRWLAYVSNESERFEVYVQAVAAGGPKWQISRGGGRQPQWSRDGRELFHVTPDRRLVSVPISLANGTLTRGSERVVAQIRLTGLDSGDHGAQYALSKDGSRVLVVSAVEAARPLNVVIDWPASLAPPR
jgi:Tol biopolymer transport system component